MIGQYYRFNGGWWSSPGRNPIIPASPVDPTIDAGSAALGSQIYAAPANAIFVAADGSGSDSNAGSQASPMATLKNAVASASAGATIVLRGGTYFEGGDTQGGALDAGIRFDKSLTIQNYPGETVWFDGSVAFSSNAWTYDLGTGLYWTAYDRLFDRSHTFSSGAADDGSGIAFGATFVDPAYPTAANPDMILFDGTQLTQTASKTNVTSGKFWVEGSTTTGLWFQATKVWIADNPSGHEIRYAAKTRLGQTFATGVTIRGIGVRRYATYVAGFGALYLTNDNTTLENMMFEDISAAATWTTIGTNITHRHITCRRIGFCYTGGGKADNSTFDSCDFQYCNNRNFNVSGPSLACVKLSTCQTITVKNCIFGNSNCSGFWTDQTCDKPWVYNSKFINIGYEAIDFEGASYAIAANCLFTGTGRYAVWNNDSDQTQVWNCTFVNSLMQSSGGAPFSIGQSARRASDPTYSWMKDSRQPSTYWDDPAHQYVCNGFTFKNNVIIIPAAAKGQGAFSCQSQQDSAGGTRQFQPDFGPQMDSNVYWWEVRPQYPFICTKGYNVSPAVYFSLTAFKNATALEINGTLASANPTNVSYQITDASLHTKATALPSDIAVLVGKSAGTKRAGCFLVGDPS